jgi:putative phage-type endonuclease
MTRPFDIIVCEQGSPEWLQARAGLVTGSCADLVMSKDLPSGGETAGKKDYRLQLAIERMTGQPELDDFKNKHTIRGHYMEPLARMAVEQKHDYLFLETGFLRHKTLMAGVSLDGHTPDFNVMLELKCPKSTTHMGYLQAGKLPAGYRWQVIHGMYVSGAKLCIFGSYDNRMPEGLDLFTVEVKAQDLPLEEYGKALDTFLASVSAMEQKLKSLQEKYRA